MQDSETDNQALEEELYPCVYCCTTFATEEEQLLHMDHCKTIPNTAQVYFYYFIHFNLNQIIQDTGNEIKPLVKCTNDGCMREFSTTRGMRVHLKTCPIQKSK